MAETRPVAGWERGWPRPRAACTADVNRDGSMSRGMRDGRTFPFERLRPVPWLADQDGSGWDPWGFDTDRSLDMRTDDLCQVCGGPRGPEVFAIAPSMSGQARSAPIVSTSTDPTRVTSKVHDDLVAITRRSVEGAAAVAWPDGFCEPHWSWLCSRGQGECQRRTDEQEAARA